MIRPDDHLWDGSGPADPLVGGLERLLRPLAHDGRALPAEFPAQRPAAPQRRAGPWLLLAAAAAVLIAGALWWTRTPPLAEGAAPRTFVAGKEPLVVQLGTLADVTLQPGSELRFQHWQKDQALFRLERGTIVARVAPPPVVQAGFFQVDTALGRVVDQGCRYELHLDSDGRARVRVTEGAVTFEFPQRTVFVPAGAGTVVDRGSGPSTPLFTDCSPELRKAVQRFDEMTAGKAGQEREKALAVLVQFCTEPRDSLVLWHLLRDADPLLRELAERALQDLAGPPDGGKTKQSHWDPEEWLPYLRTGAWTQAR